MPKCIIDTATAATNNNTDIQSGKVDQTTSQASRQLVDRSLNQSANIRRYGITTFRAIVCSCIICVLFVCLCMLSVNI